MKNIIVTTPKSEMENAAQEAQECLVAGSGFYFRKIGKKPKDIKIGKSKIYYVEDGYVRGFGLIGGLVTGQQKCEVTGRTWGDENSCFVVMASCTWKWIKPIPMKGFQGFRYFDDSQVEVVGEWTDPKPQV